MCPTMLTINNQWNILCTLTLRSLSIHSPLTHPLFTTPLSLIHYSLITRSPLTHYSITTHSKLTHHSLTTHSPLTHHSLTTHSLTIHSPHKHAPHNTLTHHQRTTHSLLCTAQNRQNRIARPGRRGGGGRGRVENLFVFMYLKNIKIS